MQYSRGQAGVAYTFDALNNGSIIGQDAWVWVVPPWDPALVLNGAGPDGSKCLAANGATGSATGAARSLPCPIVYSSSHRSVVWSMKAKFVSAVFDSNCYFGGGVDPVTPAGNSLVFGMDKWSATGNVPRTAIAGPGGLRYGDAMTLGHWYEIQLALDFGQPGASATLRYRDLTSGQQNFTTDSVLTNIPCALTPINGNYTVYWAFCRLDNSLNRSLIDDVRMDNPVIAAHPNSVSTCSVGTANLSVIAAGSDSLTYQWQVADTTAPDGWNNLENGPLAIGGSPTCATVSGARDHTVALALACTGGAGDVDGRQFRCIVSNACGSVTSAAATLSVCACLECPADFNQDGGIDGTDVSAFFDRWEVGQCDADVNNDGGVDGTDVSVFFAAWEAGGCSRGAGRKG
ncbi:MAG: hypothetical protein JSR77_12100 [Planctomycetes bacterium]|nr:hypothetical protein [Planctomycetota bacterium]